MRPSAPSKPKAGARRPFALPRARPCPAGALALAGADLCALVLSPYCQNDPDRARIEGPSLMLEQQAAQAMAVAVYELTTNAVKYGAFSTPKGRVSVEWSCDSAQRLTFRWGGPAVGLPTRQGFGARVMERIIQGQLKGELKLDWREDGVGCEITLDT